MAFTADWDSLRTIKTPQWLKDGKFGIYTHWGVYSVPGFFGCWYPSQMYKPGSSSYEHHVKTYGDPAKFGYKDLVPLFKAEKFDPEEWAELFSDSGAKFAGPVGEHHDGFSMWDTALSEWNAAKMGPKRDVVAELEKAYRKRGMKFMVAMHHAENHFFFPHAKEYPDTLDPRYSGIYGGAYRDYIDGEDFKGYIEGKSWLGYTDGVMTASALDKWLGKTKEVIDRFSPDLLWFDYGLKIVREDYKKEMAAYYYNHAERAGKDVILTFKNADMVVGSGLIDLELGGKDILQQNEWLTDTTVERPPNIGWSWAEGYVYHEPAFLLRKMVDNISKNGYYLLNVGPRPDGTIPQEVKDLLREMGKWLKVNGEAVYGATPWLVYGEGPTKSALSGMMAESGVFEDLKYTPDDFRYMCKGNDIYAFCFAWAEEYKMPALKDFYPGEVKRVTMLGSDEPLAFKKDGGGLTVTSPKENPGKHIWVLKIER